MQLYIQTLNVGNICNQNDFNGFGSVEYEYEIGKYQITIGEYVTFLNSVAKYNDPNKLYNSKINDLNFSAGIVREFKNNIYNYYPLDNDGNSSNRPITFISWHNAARFVNWLSNGQKIGFQDEKTTENGTYNLEKSDDTKTAKRNKINPNTNKPPIYYIPSHNE